jgi:chromosome segregation ATPase
MQLLSMYETNARLENSLAESLRKQREIENNLLLKTLENQEVHIQIDNAKYEAALSKNETVKLKHLIKDRENEISKHVSHIQELQNKLILNTKQSLAAEQKITQLDKQLADAISKINELEAKNEALEYKLVEADNGIGETSKEDKNSFSKMIQELEIQMLQVKLNYEHELEKINNRVGTYEEELDSLRRENEFLKAAWPSEPGKTDKIKDWIMCSITIASSMEELLKRNVQQ